jgi:hypothetical protein
LATVAADIPFTRKTPAVEVNDEQPVEVTIASYWLLSEEPVGALAVYEEAVAPVMLVNVVPLLVLNNHW